MSENGFVILSGKSPWFVEGKVEKIPKIKKKRQNVKAIPKKEKLVVNEIFALAKLETDDPYWISVLENISTGNPPRGFRYDNGFLSCRVKSKVQLLEIDLHSPKNTSEMTIKFIQEYSGVLSEKDRARNRKKIKENISNFVKIDENSWSSYKSRDQKTPLIKNYISSVRDYQKLSKNETNRLESTIYSGILIGFFNNDSIEVKNGEIVNIKGLYMDEDRFFRIDSNLCSKPKKTYKKKTKECYSPRETSLSDFGETPESQLYLKNVPFLKEWEKFLLSFKKRSD